ncbi:MAG TPA: hypothetical protein VJZ01_10400 [Lachnospiraceae bacterium]|nr:hypothetical protein [Lachnospiraceae bacterium]
MTNQDWIRDPSLSNISIDKLIFLQKLVFDGAALSEKEKMPFLLALVTKAKKNNISFTSDETTRIVDVIKKYSTPEETARLNQIMQMTTMM